MCIRDSVNSDGLIRNASSCQLKLNISEHERPMGIQLYGHVIESMVEACKMVTEAHPDVIDINFGCPVKKIANRGAGSGMMKDAVSYTHLDVYKRQPLLHSPRGG